MEHVPVLLHETIALLNVKAGGRYLDGTFGRGGHSRAIAAAGGEVLGIDRDEAAIAAAGDMTVVRGCHGDLAAIAKAHGWDCVDGILLDLGVSSPQLDEGARGFSFMREGPLDMRMDRSCALTAAEIVNTWTAEDLAQILHTWGEEPQARRIARAIVARRGFSTTTELARFIEALVGRHGGHHPATRTFQALRMAVNDEAGELTRALEGGLSLLAPGGRFAVITFESITDRMVKRFFSAHVGRDVSLQAGGTRWAGEMPRVRTLTRKPVVAGDEEQLNNPRSRSAKLRVVERFEEFERP